MANQPSHQSPSQLCFQPLHGWPPQVSPRQTVRTISSAAFHKQAVVHVPIRYKPANYTDMWSSMNTAADPSFSGKMTRCRVAASFKMFCSILTPNISWTTSPGYPLVSVATDPQNKNIVLSARAYTPALYSSARPVPVWWIPVNYTISTAASPAPVTVKTSFMSDSQVASMRSSHGQIVVLV